MTDSNTPYLGPDNTYQTARRDRLGDIILDYLSDDKLEPRQVYEEILSEVDTTIKYHRTQYNKAKTLHSLLLGMQGDIQLLLE
jgi:hypothetical protein